MIRKTSQSLNRTCSVPDQHLTNSWLALGQRLTSTRPVPDQRLISAWSVSDPLLTSSWVAVDENLTSARSAPHQYLTSYWPVSYQRLKRNWPVKASPNQYLIIARRVTKQRLIRALLVSDWNPISVWSAPDQHPIKNFWKSLTSSWIASLFHLWKFFNIEAIKMELGTIHLSSEKNWPNLI